MTDPLQITWDDGTQIELVDGDQLSRLAFVNPGGVAVVAAAPLAELVAVLRMIATTGAGDYSHSYGWQIGWQATGDGSVEVRGLVTAGGGELLVEGMVGTFAETMAMVDQLDTWLDDQGIRWPR